jgi:hypothetical protein
VCVCVVGGAGGVRDASLNCIGEAIHREKKAHTRAVDITEKLSDCFALFNVPSGKKYSTPRQIYHYLCIDVAEILQSKFFPK